LDEAGNLDFSDKGSEYFILTSLTLERPFNGLNDLISLKYDLIEFGLDIEYFHASEDKQPVRDRVFHIISKNIQHHHFDSIVVEKRKTHPKLQSDIAFYPRMPSYLLSYVFKNINSQQYDEVVVLTDTIPLQRKRKAIQKEIKTLLKKNLKAEAKFRVMHHSSKSNMCLQISDYACWAIYRKWESNDKRSYNLIDNSLVSEFEIFSEGKKEYY
jgi:hypothetical protein